MKKLFALFAILSLSVVLAACGKEEKGNFDVADGTYFAATDGFEKEYRYWVTVKVDNGRIKDASWDAYNINGGEAKCAGDSKYVCSEDGVYGMDTYGGAQAKWYVQADRTIKYLKDKQTYEVTTDNDGKTDAITGVSISVDLFFELVEEALSGDPVAEGDFTDGFYYFETEKGTKEVTYARDILEADLADGDTKADVELDLVTESFDTYTMATFLVVNGTVVIADYNYSHEAYEYLLDDNGKFVTVPNPNDATHPYNTIKIVYNADDEVYEPAAKYVTKDAAGDWYGMSNAGKVEWNKQVEKVEAELLDAQELTKATDNGVDGITGVSIHTQDFYALYEELLNA